MELAFESRELRSVCEQESTANEQLGTEIAKALRNRLADLRAATSIADLIVGNPRTIEAGAMACLCIDLGDGCQLVLRPNHPENPVTDSGSIDWPKVRRIKVTHIGGKYD